MKVVMMVVVLLFLVSILLVSADSRLTVYTDEEDGYSFSYPSDMSRYDHELNKDFGDYWKATGRLYVWIEYKDKAPENWSYDKVVDHVQTRFIRGRQGFDKHVEIINGEPIAVFERYQPDQSFPYIDKETRQWKYLYGVFNKYYVFIGSQNKVCIIACESYGRNYFNTAEYYINTIVNSFQWIHKTIYVDDDFVVDEPSNHKWTTIQKGIKDAND